LLSQGFADGIQRLDGDDLLRPQEDALLRLDEGDQGPGLEAKPAAHRGGDRDLALGLHGAEVWAWHGVSLSCESHTVMHKSNCLICGGGCQGAGA